MSISDLVPSPPRVPQDVDDRAPATEPSVEVIVAMSCVVIVLMAEKVHI